MISVSVRNFQSIESVDLEIDGFTALVGRSDVGKSALVRAMKYALTGAGGTSFVRHGRVCARRIKKTKTCDCRCSVHFKTDGFDLLWEKGDKVNQYTFNGQVYHRTGSGTPDFLLSPILKSGFDPVSLGREDKLLQIADQFDNVFLLDQTGGTVADVLSDVARLDCINLAMRMVEKDRKDAAGLRKVREQDAIEAKKVLEKFDGLDSVVKNIQTVSDKLNVLAEKRSRVQLLNAYVDKVRRLKGEMELLTQMVAVVVPDADPVKQTGDKFEKLVDFITEANQKAQIVKALSGVESVEVPSEKAIEDKASLLEKIEHWVTRLQNMKQIKWLEQVESVRLPELPPFSTEFTTLSYLIKASADVSRLEAAIETLNTEVELASAELEAAQEESNAIVCPTCTLPVGRHA